MGMGPRRALGSALVVGLLGVALPAASQPMSCDGLAPTSTATVDGTDGDDVLVGTPRSDLILAGGGNDLICGGGGGDYIHPGDGDDRVDGGGGDDLVAFTASEPLIVDLPAGTATGEGSDTLESIEDIDAGCSAHGDVLIGDAADNFFLGRAGPDTITGGDGADRLYGEEVSYNDVPPCDSYDQGADSLDGGPGDDVLFGHYGPDELDGSTGFDALHGGTDADECRNAELAVECETEEPPPPPPVCSDGVDNDGDGATDYPEGGCASPRDPTEDSYQDPDCYDGIDNDADGSFDFPADEGCLDYERSRESFCPYFGGCTPEVRLTFYVTENARRFFGEVQAPAICLDDRLVIVYRLEGKRISEPIDRVRASADGSWRTQRVSITEGRYVALLREVRHRETEGGDVVRCAGDRSRTLRVGAST